MDDKFNHLDLAVMVIEEAHSLIKCGKAKQASDLMKACIELPKDARRKSGSDPIYNALETGRTDLASLLSEKIEPYSELVGKQQELSSDIKEAFKIYFEKYDPISDKKWERFVNAINIS